MIAALNCAAKRRPTALDFESAAARRRPHISCPADPAALRRDCQHLGDLEVLAHQSAPAPYGPGFGTKVTVGFQIEASKRGVIG